MNAEKILNGSCLCGAVQIRIQGAQYTSAICHCTHCQKQSGSAFSTVLIIPSALLNISGELSEYIDRTSDGRHVSRRFCSICGSPIQTESEATEKAGISVIKAGLLEGGAPSPVLEIFCDRTLGWIPHLGDHPRFPESMPG